MKNRRLLILIIISFFLVSTFGPLGKPVDAASVVYKVKKGDTLYGISKKYKITVSELKKQNKLKSNNILIGQKLVIPPKKQTIKPVKLPASQSVKKMALSVTSWYETSSTTKTAFGVTSGNFDGAGLSFGALQENFGTDTLQPILKVLIMNHNNVVQAAFSDDFTSYNTFVDVVMNKSKAEQISWGDSISNPSNKYQVIEPWNTYFFKIGTSKEGIESQIKAADYYYAQTEKYYKTFGLWTKRGYALLFDIFVQSGYISESTKNLILTDFKQIKTAKLTPAQIETEKMKIIVKRRSADVKSQWRETWTSRKSVIANGKGMVVGYGEFFDVSPYGATLTHLNQ